MERNLAPHEGEGLGRGQGRFDSEAMRREPCLVFQGRRGLL